MGVPTCPSACCVACTVAGRCRAVANQVDEEDGGGGGRPSLWSAGMASGDRMQAKTERWSVWVGELR